MSEREKIDKLVVEAMTGSKSFEELLLEDGFKNPLPENRLRSLLLQIIARLRVRDPDALERQTDEELIENALQKRREIAFIAGIANLSKDEE